MALDELSANIRDGGITIKCENTIAELKTFVRDDNGSTHGSPHDDRVMSLAIANQMLKYVWLPEYRPKLTPTWGTLDYFASKVKKPIKEKEAPIGANNWY